MPRSQCQPARYRARLATAVALVALVSLAGCSSGTNPPKVTVTITPTASPSATATAGPEEPGPEPSNPQPEPEPEYTPPPSSGDVTLTVSKGGVDPLCTHTTCWDVHLAWEGLEKGNHIVECVTDVTGVDWQPSPPSYYFETEDGERELKCFLGYGESGWHVWVVIDGIYESNHIDW